MLKSARNLRLKPFRNPCSLQSGSHFWQIAAIACIFNKVSLNENAFQWSLAKSAYSTSLDIEKTGQRNHSVRQLHVKFMCRDFTIRGALGARSVSRPIGLVGSLAHGAVQLQGFFAGRFGIRSVRTRVRLWMPVPFFPSFQYLENR